MSSNQASTSSKQTRPVGQLERFAVDCLIYLIRGLIGLYDLMSQPVHYYNYKVYEKQREIDETRWSEQVDPRDPNSPWRQTNINERQRAIEKRVDSFGTYDALMRNAFLSFGERPCYAYRRVLHEQWSKRPEAPDKLLRQVKLADYYWITFEQFERQIEAAKRGFKNAGIRPGHKVMLYADTRPEWQISSQALIRLGAIVVTMYSTLGVEGIVHSVNETQVSHVIAQKDKVNKLLRLKPKLPHLTKIIYLDSMMCLPAAMGGSPEDVEELKRRQTSADGWPKEFEHALVECVSFNQLLCQAAEQLQDLKANEDEKDEEEEDSKRNKDSIAVIMYTSGSTGIPKGVLISHRNIMATIKSFSYVTKDFVFQPEQNICTAYLPLAHIYEFCIESMMLFHGVRFGFATPHTLTDKSPGLLPGQQGDLTKLQPTVMVMVPLVLDRIVQGVKQVLSTQSYFKQRLVTHLIRYKMHWQARHYETPLVDKIVCSKIALALGGRAKYVICGSAPLSGKTQTFVRAALNLKLPQGFGTTETCAATSCQLFDDQSTDNVGLPVAGCQIKLEPWIEGNYRPTDKPRPRGEIVVGGEMIAHGYFNLEEQTKESFYVDERGVRWYRTGDIGEFLPNGNLKIIDRKKDLVKLQNGEYISLGKIESTLKSNPYLDNFCVYASSKHNYVVALGPANEAAMRQLAREIVDEAQRRSPPNGHHEDRRRLLAAAARDHGDQALEQLKEVLAEYEADELNNNNQEQQETFDRNERKMSTLSQQSTGAGGGQLIISERLNRLCQNRLIREHVLAQMDRLARERELMTLEIPKRILLLAEEWTEDKNLVTAAMKIRRNYIYKRYEQDLQQLYAD